MNGNSPTNGFRTFSKIALALYSLEKPIEWKQLADIVYLLTFSPLYSLEKPIEWKHEVSQKEKHNILALYSLEKPIEWKHWYGAICSFFRQGRVSLLARETN